MKPIVISDNYTIINTQGIRFIEKIDANKYGLGSHQGEFLLKVTYRKEVMSYYYNAQHLRDAQYDRIRQVMDSEYGPKNKT